MEVGLPKKDQKCIKAATQLTNVDSIFLVDSNATRIHGSLLTRSHWELQDLLAVTVVNGGQSRAVNHDQTILGIACNITCCRDKIV